MICSRSTVLAVVLWLAAVTGLTSCGYTASSALPAEHRSVSVEPFKNAIDFTAQRRRNVYFPLLEVRVREETLKRFRFDGHLRIAESDNADLLLKGVLVHYSRDPLRYTDGDDVEEYRVQVIVDLELWDVEQAELVWTEDDFAGEATYFISGPLASSEEAAVEEATEDLARRIVERTVENW